jgi:flagellar assembly protein FliH
VFLPEDPKESGPMVWRRVSQAGTPKADAAAEQPDTEALQAEWQRECERRVREAHAGGFREGEAAGKSRAAAEVQPVMERLAKSIDEMSQLRPRLRRDAEGDVLRLALAIARRVLRRELAVDPDAMHGLVLGALEKLQSKEISRVRVHPSHAAQVTAYLRKAIPSTNVDVVPDGAHEPGTVIFETERGDLDASVDSQLQEIERGLLDRLNKQG